MRYQVRLVNYIVAKQVKEQSKDKSEDKNINGKGDVKNEN